MVMRLIRESCESAGLQRPIFRCTNCADRQAESLVLLAVITNLAPKQSLAGDMRSQSECDELRERFFPAKGATLLPARLK